MHVIITSLALHYSPNELWFYLVDFKEGVEFTSYTKHGTLPHSRAIAVQSDREFGLCCLEDVEREISRRGELFRNAGCQKISEFRGAGNELARIVLVIDEFQEFFSEDDRLATTAKQLLERIARQGRAFGIHMILGTQTLGGRQTLPRNVREMLTTRLAFRSSEADSRLALFDDPGASELSHPGEGISHTSGGSQRVPGGVPFP